MLYSLSYFLNGVSLMFFAVAAVHMQCLVRRGNSKLHRLFAFCLLWMVLIEIKELVISFDPAYQYGILGPGYTFPDLFTLPLISLFFFELVMPGRVTAGYAMRLLVPFLLLIAAYLAGLLFFPYISYTDFSSLVRVLPAFLPLVLLAYVSYTIGYCVFALVRVVVYSVRYGEQIAQAYSFSERIHLRWIRWMAAVLASYLIGYVGIIVFVNTPFTDVVIYLMSLAVWGILYGCVVRHRIPTIIENYWKEEPLSGLRGIADCGESGEPNAEQTRIAALRKSIDAAIDERKIYLNSSLTIVELAAECQTNRTHLSQFFNSELGMPFRDYINRCRIEQAAVPLLEDRERDYKIEEVALLSGFGSTSTFYRAFAKEKGVTPQQWMVRCRK